MEEGKIKPMPAGAEGYVIPDCGSVALKYLDPEKRYRAKMYLLSPAITRQICEIAGVSADFDLAGIRSASLDLFQTRGSIVFEIERSAKPGEIVIRIMRERWASIDEGHRDDLTGVRTTYQAKSLPDKVLTLVAKCLRIDSQNVGTFIIRVNLKHRACGLFAEEGAGDIFPDSSYAEYFLGSQPDLDQAATIDSEPLNLVASSDGIITEVSAASSASSSFSNSSSLSGVSLSSSSSSSSYTSSLSADSSSSSSAFMLVPDSEPMMESTPDVTSTEIVEAKSNVDLSHVATVGSTLSEAEVMPPVSNPFARARAGVLISAGQSSAGRSRPGNGNFRSRRGPEEEFSHDFSDEGEAGVRASKSTVEYIEEAPGSPSSLNRFLPAGATEYGHTSGNGELSQVGDDATASSIGLDDPVVSGDQDNGNFPTADVSQPENLFYPNESVGGNVGFLEDRIDSNGEADEDSGDRDADLESDEPLKKNRSDSSPGATDLELSATGFDTRSYGADAVGIGASPPDQSEHNFNDAASGDVEAASALAEKVERGFSSYYFKDDEPPPTTFDAVAAGGDVVDGAARTINDSLPTQHEEGGFSIQTGKSNTAGNFDNPSPGAAAFAEVVSEPKLGPTVPESIYSKRDVDQLLKQQSDTIISALSGSFAAQQRSFREGVDRQEKLFSNVTDRLVSQLEQSRQKLELTVEQSEESTQYKLEAFRHELAQELAQYRGYVSPEGLPAPPPMSGTPVETKDVSSKVRRRQLSSDLGAGLGLKSLVLITIVLLVIILFIVLDLSNRLDAAAGKFAPLAPSNSSAAPSPANSNSPQGNGR